MTMYVSMWITFLFVSCSSLCQYLHERQSEDLLWKFYRVIYQTIYLYECVCGDNPGPLTSFAFIEYLHT